MHPANTHRTDIRRRAVRARAVGLMLCGAAALCAAGVTAAQGPSARDAARAMAESARCERCHTFDGALSHPVGVRAGAGVPESLPLEGGRITCTTCHEPIEHEGRVGGPMLRTVRGTIGAGGVAAAGLCVQCHEPSSGTRADAHATGMGRAHLAAGIGRARPAAGAARRLDEESVRCLGCHDGAIGGDAGVHEQGRLDQERAARDHPVGVVYSTASARRRDIRLHEPSRLDPRVRLVDSMVGCGSCHSVYARQNALLVMSNLQSRLCLSCHAE